MPRTLPDIKDKMDVDSAAEIVSIGYPDNEDELETLIFWSCFPNDPVCWATFPYISSLRDEFLAPAMAKFIEFNLSHRQMELVSDVFWLFINERGEAFRSRILSMMEDEDAKALFSWPEYSLEQYAEDRRRFDDVNMRSRPGQAEPEDVDAGFPPPGIKDEYDVECAKNLVEIGYPGNERRLDELIFWACFPDKPVYSIAFPYINSLRKELLAPAMAVFLESLLDRGQVDLMADAIGMFIHERGECFSSLIASHMRSDETKALFLSGKYSAGEVLD